MCKIKPSSWSNIYIKKLQLQECRRTCRCGTPVSRCSDWRLWMNTAVNCWRAIPVSARAQSSSSSCFPNPRTSILTLQKTGKRMLPRQAEQKLIIHARIYKNYMKSLKPNLIKDCFVRQYHDHAIRNLSEQR